MQYQDSARPFQSTLDLMRDIGLGLGIQGTLVTLLYT